MRPLYYNAPVLLFAGGINTIGAGFTFFKTTLDVLKTDLPVQGCLCYQLLFLVHHCSLKGHYPQLYNSPIVSLQLRIILYASNEVNYMVCVIINLLIFQVLQDFSVGFAGLKRFALHQFYNDCLQIEIVI